MQKNKEDNMVTMVNTTSQTSLMVQENHSNNEQKIGSCRTKSDKLIYGDRENDLNQHTKISQNSLFVPKALGSLSVIHDGREFFVIHPDGSQSAIQRAYLSKELRGISSKTVQKMADGGYFSIRKSESDYALSFYCRLRGGGPLGAVGTFFVTWGIGAIMCATGTVLVVTGVGAPAGATLIASGATTMGVAAPLAAAAVAAPTP